MNISESPDAFSPVNAAPRGCTFQPPLVSVIIVNYNYGRFLDQAVDSVFHQTYPNIECVIVDNASTDDSPGVLAAIADRYPQAIILRRPGNDGQTAASLDGLEASSGAYVILMYADDVLLAHAAETHVAAHLSLRIHVGFTSGDMLQASDGQVVLATGQELNRYVRSGRGRRKNVVRPYRDAIEAGWPPESVVKSITEKIHFVPTLTTRWIWSPTSGLCFRRDALRLFADNPDLVNLRTGTDVYFSCAIGGLCGGAIIDEPVFIYRIHGGNILTRRPQLNQIVGIELDSLDNNNKNAQLMVIDHLVAHASRFCQRDWARFHYAALLMRVDCRDGNPRLPPWQRRSRAAKRLAESHESVAAALGTGLTIFLMLWFRVPFRAVIAAIDKRK